MLAQHLGCERALDVVRTVQGQLREGFPAQAVGKEELESLLWSD